jgi:uncharacterized protein YrrD
MSLLMRASDIMKLPVVAIDVGDAIADIKDIVYGSTEGQVFGFTLNKRGFLAGPMKKALHWEDIVGLGRHAVMIETSDVVRPLKGDEVGALAKQKDRAVLGTDVLSESGTRLGHVTDVIVMGGGPPEVVGYEIEASETMGPRAGKRVLIPLPDTLSISGEALMVPAAAEPFVADDLAGFGASVEQFRAQLGNGSATQ